MPHRIDRRFLHLLSVLLLAAAALGVGGCSTNPATGRMQFQMLSVEQEVAMGESSMPELISEYGGRVQNEAVNEYVTQIGSLLAQQTEADYPNLPWEFIVLDSEIVNAFALPGGKVFISRGLLVQLDDEAELAGVLGHEIGHVVAEHVDERMSRAMLLELGVAITGATTESDLATYAAGLFGNGYILHFGRSQESESDVLGMRYMTRAGYDPAALLGVMEVLDELSAGNKQPEFLSTHPHPETRMETINDELRKNYGTVQGDSAPVRNRERFQREVLNRLN